VSAYVVVQVLYSSGHHTSQGLPQPYRCWDPLSKSLSVRPRRPRTGRRV